MGSRALAAALALGALVLPGCGGGSSPKGATTTAATGTTTSAARPTAGTGPRISTPFGSMAGLPGILATPPPWGANAGRLRARLKAIGLPALGAEGEAVHIHQHLDLFAGGHRVTVPATIGIDPAQGFISPLHTHDTSGVLHVESPTVTSFSLGQFFAVWGVRLDARCLGGLCAGHGRQLRAWVNGHLVPGDPTRIVLASHQEIVIAYGTPAQMPRRVPAAYRFAAGL